jgi:hypothetical protein
VQFRLTRRALEDLDLAVEVYARRPASDYMDAHPVVRAFVERRRQDPTGQESTRLPVTAAPVYNLHHGRHRGLTWHDVESDVVWLLGVAWHESGSHDDAYAVLKQRDEAGILMPTQEDYLDLELTLQEARSFATQVAQQAPALMQRARDRPGEETREVIAGRLDVGVVVEAVAFPGEPGSLEEVWIAFGMPPMPGPCELPPQPEWLTIVLAAMLPDAAYADLQFGGRFPRSGGSRPNEIVVCWRNF